MNKSSLALEDHFTWDNYCSWPDSERWEIISGTAFNMSPAPLIRHQWIQHKLDRILGNFFLNKSCYVFPAPTDVKLSNEDVVQPDLLVVCDKRKIKSTHIEGAPNLIIEIISPSSATYDRVQKMQLYAKSGVEEVWLITPYPWLAEVYSLDGTNYRLIQSCTKNDTLKSEIFSELEVRLEQIFDFSIDKEEQIMLIKETHPPYGKKNNE